MKASPLAQVKAEYGSKDKLIDKIASKLKRAKDESDAGFRKRLLKVSSSRLLQLADRVAGEKKK